MKRVLIVTAIVMMLAATFGCCRDRTRWATRGASCSSCGGAELAPPVYNGAILPPTGTGVMPGAVEVVPAN